MTNTNNTYALDDQIEEDNNNISNDEIRLEVTDNRNGNSYVSIYKVPFKSLHYNEKRLICFSIINREPCSYGLCCTYAHSLDEQRIDVERKFIYQIILDQNLMNFYSLTNPKTNEIYKNLLFVTRTCEKCTNNECTGGYNCRYGVNHQSLKLCKNDLLTGQCLNKIINIDVPSHIVQKVIDATPEIFACSSYQGCINGHHLSLRNLVSYYKYIHQKENSKKNKYQSVRYIDIDPLKRIFRNNSDDVYMNMDSDDSTDEEINSWFRKDDDESEVDE